MHGRNFSSVDMGRRQALKESGSLGLLALFTLLGLVPGAAWAATNKAAFEAKTLSEALDALGGITPVDSALIKLTAPDIAENGATVPVTVESSLPRTQQISILVEKNPTILAASFNISEGLEGFITARIKMAQTSAVIVLVKADGKFYRASTEVKVTAGGC
ncbi:MAG: thiosulfate oxidation carrier protein SoxY [Sideroxyarcus sp.]|nr:thiosulfate oxidation carrier protein SoxY [Sideroxyarcus sp.]